jgi:hypothetical protein
MAEPKKISVSHIPEKENGATPLPYQIMAELIPAHHAHLAEARIALAWRYGWVEDADGHLRLGQAKKASDLDFTLHNYDFVIILNFDAWNAADFSMEQMRALLDHELCHCQISQDEDGEEKRDTAGRPVWRIRKHDIEEFTEIVDRHGLWRKDLEQFARVAMEKAKDAGTLFEGANPGPSPAVASAAKKLAELVKGGVGSVTIEAAGSSVTIDAASVDLFRKNCDRIIENAAEDADELPLTFQDAQHAQDAVHVAEDLQALAKVAPGLAGDAVRRVLGDTPEAARLLDLLKPPSPEAVEALLDKAMRFCIERGTVTAEGIHRALNLPLKQAMNLVDAMVQGKFLAREANAIVCKITAEQWAELRAVESAA